MSSLRNRLLAKKSWAIFFLVVIFLVLMINAIGQIFFLNKTDSMPKGIYIKLINKDPDIGDVIVFYSKYYKGNLLKYVAAMDNGEFCFDEEGDLWIDGLPHVRKNIQKYFDQDSEESKCQTLKKGNLLVLGDHPNSYDSRYFGPISKKEIIARVKLVFELQ